MANYAMILVLLFYSLFSLVSSDYDPFADNVLFSLNWQGSVELADVPLPEDGLSNEDTLLMTTKDKEQYKCIIPNVLREDHQADIDSYTGPDELTLLKPLFTQTSCSYRIESYWTYELCHGRFLRQYHEEKEPGKKAKLQEYYLGNYNPAPPESYAPPKETPDAGNRLEMSKIKTRLQKVEGIEIPYFAVNFTDGTKCDLTNEPRRVSIHYVCQEEGKGEVYGLKETSTCEYEVVVLTSILCRHPAYKMKKDPVNQIRCHSMPGSPRRPRSLDNLELENTVGRFNHRRTLFKRARHAQNAFKKMEEEAPATTQEKPEETATPHPRTETNIGSNTDKQLLTQFLTGDYCIQGGSGWWKHEFCYGKHTTQFHEERNQKTVIVLGNWDKARHIQWMKDNPLKKPKPAGQRKGISHYYGMGDKCDLTGKNRWVEVKLRCKEYPNQPHAVAIYLVEPSSCQYILVVESPILCPLIDQADDYGLIEQL